MRGVWQPLYVAASPVRTGSTADKLSLRAPASAAFKTTHRRATLELSVKPRTFLANFRIRVCAKAALFPVMVCLVFLLRTGSGHAQSQSGINGTVADASQAVINGARVTITNKS